MEPSVSGHAAPSVSSQSIHEHSLAIEQVFRGITQTLNHVLIVITKHLEIVANTYSPTSVQDTDSLGNAISTARRAIEILRRPLPPSELESILRLEFHASPEDLESRAILSPREREVLRWIAVGKTHVETATILGISERTVEQHVRNAKKKLNAVSTIQAVVEAMNQREIQP